MAHYFATYDDSEIAYGDTMQEVKQQVRESFYASVIDQVKFHKVD